MQSLAYRCCCSCPCVGVLGKVYGFAQGLAGLEVRDTLFGNVDRFAAARVATNAGRPTRHGKAAKAANFNALALYQGVADGVLNGFDGVFSITLGELCKAGSQLFN